MELSDGTVLFDDIVRVSSVVSVLFDFEGARHPAARQVFTGPIYDKVDQAPDFPAGDFAKWVARNAEYPAKARRKGIEGNVVVMIVVEPDGSVSILQTLTAPDKTLRDEVHRVIESAPLWKPARVAGKAVRMRMLVGIPFVIAK